MSGPEERRHAVELYFTTPMTTAQMVKHLGYPTKPVPGTLAGGGSPVCRPYDPTHHPTGDKGPRQSNRCRVACSRSGPPNGSARASERSTTGSRRTAKAEWPRCRPETRTPRRTADGLDSVLNRFLEDESLFGEFLRIPVSESGVEPPVVGPPHAVVGAAPQLPDRGVAVPAHELLLQQPVRRLGHVVAVGAAPARRRSFDIEHVERLVDSRVVEPAAPVGAEHLDVRQREVEGGERAQHQARVPCGSDRLRVYALVMPCSRMMPPMRLPDAVTPTAHQQYLVSSFRLEGLPIIWRKI